VRSTQSPSPQCAMAHVREGGGERIILDTKLAELMIEDLGIIEAPLIRKGTGTCLAGSPY
jgi:hypothetical protein